LSGNGTVVPGIRLHRQQPITVLLNINFHLMNSYTKKRREKEPGFFFWLLQLNMNANAGITRQHTINNDDELYFSLGLLTHGYLNSKGDGGW
jgi:hypothetical protein